MQQEPSPGTDIGLGVVLSAVALLIIYGTLELPPGSFEPLGSASIPRYVSAGILVFSIWIILRAVSRARARKQRGDGAAALSTFPRRYDLAIALVVMTVIYVAVMAMDWVSFSIATSVFLLASTGMLTAFHRRTLPVVAGLALGLGFGLAYLFTRVFVIDLP